MVSGVRSAAMAPQLIVSRPVGEPQCRDRQRFDRGHELLHQRHRIGRVGKDHREFLAAVARHQVGVPRGVAQGGGDAAQRGIAGGMAVQVVVLLEVVDIRQRDAQALPVRTAVRVEPRQLGIQVPAVGDAGQRVLQHLQRQAHLFLQQLAVGLAQRQLRAHAVGDVGHIAHRAGRHAVAVLDRGQRPQPADLAVGRMIRKMIE